MGGFECAEPRFGRLLAFIAISFFRHLSILPQSSHFRWSRRLCYFTCSQPFTQSSISIRTSAGLRDVEAHFVNRELPTRLKAARRARPGTYSRATHALTSVGGGPSNSFNPESIKTKESWFVGPAWFPGAKERHKHENPSQTWFWKIRAEMELVEIE